MKPAYIYIILGVLVASLRFWFKQYDQFLLIGGMMLLMIGIYSISKSLPPKREEDFQERIFPKEEENNTEEKEKTEN
ncbi:MAG: hypothetical protein Q4A09_01465 [Capnocytophaga felis]|uniref:Uncharacterized protein n=1 Tax=Capnocytophaga felis TaxID=2267611 RepID=A0A5M4BA30_9FLAO|nr:hypothetical protein [Capnocytophaga felis]MDO4781868.1 hypothetical protein [Capnocytophaga felis]GET46409.1 hypothetical protein RCZ01_17110 [Capnocytophaga felis]GET48298.1 hypothetical protein RCZ02_11290 [Capnocytophaga felis]